MIYRLLQPNMQRRSLAIGVKGGKAVAPGFPKAKGSVPKPPN